MSFLCSKPFQISPLYPNLKPKHFKFQIVTTWFIIAPSYTHMKHFPYPFSDCVFFRICSSLSNLPSLTSSPRLLVHCDTATLPFPQLHRHVHRSYTFAVSPPWTSDLGFTCVSLPHPLQWYLLNQTFSDSSIYKYNSPQPTVPALLILLFWLYFLNKLYSLYIITIYICVCVYIYSPYIYPLYIYIHYNILQFIFINF